MDREGIDILNRSGNENLRTNSFESQVKFLFAKCNEISLVWNN